MLIRMASQWKTFQQILRGTEHLVFNEAPKLLRTLQDPESVQRTIQQGLRMSIEALIGGPIFDPPKQITSGRPVTERFTPTDRRARRIEYAPDLDGQADPGEIVWTWVVFEDDPTRGKDRPVLVVGRESRTLLGLMLSSQTHHADDATWVSIGAGAWDSGYEDGQAKPSWVRLDRVLDVPEEGIRREGAILDRPTFEIIATRLRTEYRWS